MSDEPREWWMVSLDGEHRICETQKSAEFIFNMISGPKLSCTIEPELTHVVEYSALEKANARIEKLQAEVEQLKASLEKENFVGLFWALKRLQNQKARIEKLRAALEFYANAMAFGIDRRSGKLVEMEPVAGAYVVKEPTMGDTPIEFGTTARAALEEEANLDQEQKEERKIL